MENHQRIRMVDTREYVDTLRGLVEEGREVSLVVAGHSMTPFLVHYRDTIFFKKPDRPLQRGDMVFYQRDSGQYVMHRIVRVRGDVFDIIGDAETEIERGIRRGQIFAVVTRVRRKGRMLTHGSFWWEFFEHVWLHMIPLRRIISAAYEKFK